MNTSVQVSQNGRKRNLGTTSSFSFPNQQRQQQQSRIPSYNDPSSSSALLWVDKYKPQRVDQLVVAPKKIAEIRQFLLSFSTSTLGPKLLILTGGPGIGKSTTVVLLAQELGLQIVQWNDNHTNTMSSTQYHYHGKEDYSNSLSFISSTRDMNSTMNYHGQNHHQSSNSDIHPFSSLSEFLHSATVGYHSIVQESNYSHDSTLFHTKDSRTSATKLDTKISYNKSIRKQKNIVNNSWKEEYPILPKEDEEDSSIHHKIKKRHIIGGISSSSSSPHRCIPSSNIEKIIDNRTQVKGPSLQYSSIILMEELPTLHTVEREEQFRQLMSHYIHITQVPMVLIFSNVYEGKYRPEDLERLVDQTLLYSPRVCIVEVNPVTKVNIKKCVENILQGEFGTIQGKRVGFLSSSSSSKLNHNQRSYIPTVDATWIEEIHSCTGGDLRQVIMTLQFLYCGVRNHDKREMNHSKKKKKDDRKQGNLENYHRDITLSTFHALGKLLYAKRKTSQEIQLSSSSLSDGTDRRLPLDFDPEKVLEGSSIGLYGALSFLGYHTPEFFTDITELSEALDTFSDAAFFMDKLYSGLGDSIYPTGYASSFASRAVAGANKHPAPNKFRQFTAPKYFHVVRKREGNKLKISQMLRRMSCCDEHLQMDINLSTSNHFFMESFSFLHRLLPLETQALVENMHLGEGTMENSEADYLASIRRQNEILQMDDIVDSDDDTHQKKRSDVTL